MSSNGVVSSGPIALRPIAQERVWGVTELPGWYAPPAQGKPIGELWLTAVECVAQSEAAQGKTLGALAEAAPERFGARAGQGFPLLVKMLFPQEKLSVQVHPNDAEAQVLGQPRGKTECWYVLSAEPGAEVALGFREGVSKEELRAAIVSNTLEEKLRYVPVKAGDMVYVDAGTVHAIGGGMVVLETQEYSDVTYRLYDYGRPRELHVDAGLGVSKTETQAGLVAPVQMDGFARLCSSPYFVVDKFVLAGGSAELGKVGEMQLLVALDDGCFVESSAGTAVPLLPGWATLLPAEDVAYRLRSAFGATVVRIAER
jgi:mannose-6-phosphate isomerase